MNPRVKQVRANDDYTLVLTFVNGEVRLFDASLTTFALFSSTGN